MPSVADIVIDPEVARVRFACDLTACRGACCTLPGGKGAPLLPSELGEVERAYTVVKKHLSPEHLASINRFGLYEMSLNGATTTCFENRACVFVTFEMGIARCSIEKAYFEGELEWRKPMSCHLFPVRVDRGIVQRLRYEIIPECRPAVERGNRENIWLSDFLKDPLSRVYGEGWYGQFLKLCELERSSEES